MPRIAVFGLGQFGTAIAEALTDKGVDVMAFDHNAERVEEIKDRVSVAVVLDSTDERALRAWRWCSTRRTSGRCGPWASTRCGSPS